jgi:hypothetical protein
VKLMICIPAAALVATLTACGAGALKAPDEAKTSGGTVTGTFMRVGGPLGLGGTQPRPVPLTGTVLFTARHHRMFAVGVGKTGRFTVGLPAGRYVVSGTSPSMGEVLASGATVDPPCALPTSVTVVADRMVRVSVVCVVP